MLPIARNNLSFSSSWKRAFVVTFVFVTLAFGLFWLDLFRGYKAEVTVLVVSKSETAVLAQNIAADMKELTQTLSFYERVLASSDLIDDDFEGYTPDKRKALWNETVSVKHEKGSGILVISAQGETPEKAKRLANETTKTLLAVTGFYYNVKTDVDVRIVDGPIVATTVAQPVAFGAISLLSSLIVTFLFFLFLNILPQFFRAERSDVPLAEMYAAPEKAYPEFAVGETVPWIDPKKFIPAKPNTLSFENSFPEKNEEISAMNIPEAAPPVSSAHQITPRSSRAAAAPANLPIAHTDIVFQAAEEVNEEAPVFPEVSPVAEPEIAEAAFEVQPVTPELPTESEEIIAPEIAPAVSDENFSKTQGEPLGFPTRGEHGIQAPAIPPQTNEPTIDEYKRRLNELLSGGK